MKVAGNSWLESRQSRRVLALLALAFVVRCIWWYFFAFVIENEGAEYTAIARNLASGHGYVGLLGGTNTIFPPLYPVLIALVSPLTGGDLEAAGRFISLICGTGLVFCLYKIGEHLFDEEIGCLTGLIAACHPVLISLSSTVYSESLALFLIAGAILSSVLVSHRPTALRAIVTGLLFGFAYLTRPESLPIGLIVISFCAVLGIRTRWPRRVVARNWLLSVAGVLVVSAPYSIYLSMNSHSFQWNGKSEVVAAINDRIQGGMNFDQANRGLDSLEEPGGVYLEPDQFEILKRGASGRAGAMKTILRAPVHRSKALAGEIARQRLLGFPVAGFLVLLGLSVTGWWRKSLTSGLMLIAILALQLVTFLALEFWFERYYLPLLLTLVFWCALGARSVRQAGEAFLLRLGSRAATARSSATLVAGSVIAAMLALSLQATVKAVELGDDANRVQLREAGRWIRENFEGAAPVVATYSSVIAFYAEGRLAYLPYAPEELAVEYLRRLEPDFVVVSANDARRTPYNVKWLEDRGPKDCLEPIRTISGADGGSMRIWKWTCRATQGEGK